MLTLLIGTAVLLAPANDTTWRCFALSYPGVPTDAAAMYPHRLALQGSDSGAVVSRAPGGDEGFWRMFRNVGSRWTRGPGDSLSVSFNNGFTWVEFALLARGDSLSGRGVIHYDFGDPKDHPRFAIAGKARRCARADLVGPERDPEALAQARAYEAWEAFQTSERRRVAAIELPYSGTWRFVVEVEGEPPAVIYGRTAAHPSDVDTDLFRRDTSYTDLASRRPAEGFLVPMLLGRDTLLLSEGDFQNDRPPVLTASFSVRELPVEGPGDSTVWPANADVVQALSRLATDEGARNTPWARASRAIHEVWWEGRPGRIDGSIRVRRDGSASFELVVERAGKRVVRVTGERIGSGTASEGKPVEQR